MNDSPRLRADGLIRGLVALALCLVATHAALAAAPPGRATVAASAADTWREECGSCHLAYPPRLLPAAAWRQLLGRLDRHFGADASLSPERAALVRNYLEAHASREAAAPAGAEPRITRLPWFEREHDEVPAEVWRRPSVRSRGNCGACHPGAEQGSFEEHGIRIPK